MNNIISEIKMLDIVLKWFASNQTKKFEMHIAVQHIILEFPELSTTDFHDWAKMMVDKLVKDEKLKTNAKEVGFSGQPIFYSVTFEGKLFSRSGGYAQQQIDANQIREDREINAKVAL